MYRLFLLAFAAMIATPLQSQDTLLAQLRGRRDSVLLAWREAQTLADLADSLERERATAGADTIAVGGLLIIANRSPLPLRAAAERAWPVVDSLYGPLAAELTQHPFIIRAVDPDTAVRRAVLHVGVELPWDLDIATTTAVLLTTVTPPRADRALDEWLGGPLRPTSLPDDERRAVFVQLVTAPSEAVRRCFLGDITRCRDVLQLSDSGDLVERWYVTPAEREVLVTRWSSYFERGATAASLQRCRQHHDDACTALLRSLPLATLPPLARIARLTLLREALHAGGREAYARLVASPAMPMSARLSDAAAMDIDTVVARWRNRILGTRPVALTVPWWAVLVAVGWTAFFGVCAVRSSRWRL